MQKLNPRWKFFPHKKRKIRIRCFSVRIIWLIFASRKQAEMGCGPQRPR
uniref:Uncharacterized protein n=1 Tax=Siphoviridae sp. ctBLh2 TaxID=2827803 RepID=A0A8S5S3C5_9CAUD|nr:MAG TPA: hypothetical protein [Siphoviridae sp. ctBLh2]